MHLAEMTNNQKTVGGAMQRRIPLSAAGIAFAIVLLAAMARYRPPPPKPVDAPQTVFSAARAMTLLELLVGDNEPHPVGSEANANVREKIVAELQRWNYQPEIHRGSVAGKTVRNIIALREGTGSGPALMLASHYDSVSRGPGAGDSAASVAAILEIARILQQGPTPHHDVVLLITDGEEAGLLGAKAFVDPDQGHPLARRVAMVVNLDARGSAGASLMYQTSKGNLDLVRTLAASLPRPVTGSLFNAVYQRMPNDTDFTIFADAGMNGYNLAFIGDAQNYHTAQDSLAHLDPGTMQHTGDNALALVRALDAADWDQWHTADAVYFDVMSMAVVWWPEPWTPALLAGAALLFLIPWVRGLRSGALSVRRLAWGLAAAAIVLALPVGLSLTANALLGNIIRSRQQWPDNPLPIVLAHWGLALLTFAVAARFLAPRACLWGLWSGAWFWWLALSAAATIIVPSGSYLFLVPTAAAVLAGAAASALNRHEGVLPQLAAGLLPALTALLLWLPLELLLYDALGLAVNSLTTFRASLVFVALLPLVPLPTTPQSMNQ